MIDTLIKAGQAVHIFDDYTGRFVACIFVRTASSLSTYRKRTIQQWCDEGKLIAYKVSGHWLVSIESLESFAIARDEQLQIA